MSKVIRPSGADFDVNVSLMERDITNGRVNDCRRCPNALALQRRLPKAAHIFVGVDSVIVNHKNERYSAMLPGKVMAWIQHYDMTGYGYDPIRYTLSFEYISKERG
jgi:hypothetical protein